MQREKNEMRVSRELEKDVANGLVNQRVAPEIQLSELVMELWRKKVLVVAVVFVVSILTVVYALYLPNIYRSSLVLSSAESDEAGMSGLAAQYGGLAALAGINLGSGASQKVDEAVELLNSWPFLKLVTDKHNLKPYLFAIEKYDTESGQLVFDQERYDSKLNVWVVDKNGVPSDYQTYKAIRAILDVQQDKKTGFISVSVEHVSPQFAYNLVVLFKNELNEYFRERDLQRSLRNIAYLEQKALENKYKDLNSIFYRMIEAETRSSMLASVDEEYLLRTVVPAMVPEEKDSPRRSVICILGAILGFILGGLIAVAPLFWKRGIN